MSFSRQFVGVLGFVSLGAGASVAKEIIAYRTDCKATATGKVEATAAITHGVVNVLGVDADSFVQSFQINDPFILTFGDAQTVSASVSDSAFDGCWTSAEAKVEGTSTYKFVGDTITMDFQAYSDRDHKQAIDRSPLGTGPGGAWLTDTDYAIPQLDALQVEVPFKLADYGYAWPLKATLVVKRADSGATTGSVVGVWQIFRDENCNCEIDAGDFSDWGSAGIAFPNDSFSDVQEFELKPASYIVAYTYFLNSHLDFDSANCSEDGGASSTVNDKFTALIEIQ